LNGLLDHDNVKIHISQIGFCYCFCLLFDFLAWYFFLSLSIQTSPWHTKSLDSEDSEKQQKKNKAIIDFSPLKNQERKQSGLAEFAFMMIDYIYIYKV